MLLWSFSILYGSLQNNFIMVSNLPFIEGILNVKHVFALSLLKLKWHSIIIYDSTLDIPMIAFRYLRCILFRPQKQYKD